MCETAHTRRVGKILRTPREEAGDVPNVSPTERNVKSNLHSSKADFLTHCILQIYHEFIWLTIRRVSRDRSAFIPESSTVI